MTGESEPRGQYRAFISYSHKDAAFGRRLHQQLESYRLPRRLVGRATPLGEVPARLAPIFRDREELPAHHDLSEKVRAALAASDALVVVCSPNAAASPWVAREIETFRGLHPDRPVLCALIGGEPRDAFPPALRTPAPDGPDIEPLAADFRPDADGARLGLLKLVAGILGLGLDELVQRDAQRQVARVTAVTAAALVVTLSMGLLTLYALQARAEALRQRAEAEGLIEFMLTDLRKGLAAVGRLKLMTDVNEQALAYYERDPGHTARSVRLRAQVLHALGEDDISRDDSAAAHTRFYQAYALTDRLLAAAPDDPERILVHAQSEYWVGRLEYDAGRRPGAEKHWLAYRVLARRLVAKDARNPEHLRELSYAEGNLCSAALMKPKKFEEAERACTQALRIMERAAAAPNAPQDIQESVANREGWLADVYHESGKAGPALEHRRRQEHILAALLASDPKNKDLRAKWLAVQRGLAILEFEEGQRAAARARQLKVLAELDAMIAFDPDNQVWARRKRQIEDDLKRKD